jgi:hypothetical protein
VNSALLEKACAFYVGDWKGRQHVKVERKSFHKDEFGNMRDSWAIVSDTSSVWNRLEEWEFEPSPSHRSLEFLDRCRYTLEEALKVVGLK